MGDSVESKKWYQYSSSIYRWTKRGKKYQATSGEDVMFGSDLFRGHQKVGWVVVLVGAALLLGVYLRLLLVQ